MQQGPNETNPFDVELNCMTEQEEESHQAAQNGVLFPRDVADVSWHEPRFENLPLAPGPSLQHH